MKRGQRPAKPRPQRDLADGFWDRPVLMNMVADLFFVLGAAGLVYAALLALQRLPLFPLRQLVVAGALEQVTRPQVEVAARSSLVGNFFTVNLDVVRGNFEKLPWVRRAAVRRLWPDGVEVALEEHVAAARWRRPDGEAQLVDSHGEVFAASSEDPALPVFAGPEGSAAQMLGQHRAFARALAPLGRTPQALALTARQAWQLRLDDGLVLELGRDQAKSPLEERLNRFVATYNEVQQRIAGRAGLIDMRYPNGFALRPLRGGEQQNKKS